jgi:S1-C subfamily serine protease
VIGRPGALITGLILTLSACGAASEPLDDDPVDAALPAAIGVRADGCSPTEGIGSGSMIDTDLAVTAAHVVAGATEVRVVDTAGETHAADVVMFDPALDLAVLRTTRPIGTPLRIGEAPEAGDSAAVATFRGADGERALVGSRVTVVRPVNIDTTDIYLDQNVTRAGFEVTADIEPGDSGTVVVVPGGVAVGVIWARSTQRGDRAWAIDLPVELGDAAHRASLTDPVDLGPCAR